MGSTLCSLVLLSETLAWSLNTGLTVALESGTPTGVVVASGSLNSANTSNSYGRRAYNFTAQYTSPLGFSDGLIVQVLNYKFYTGLVLVFVIWLVVFAWMIVPIDQHKVINLQNRTTNLMNMLNVFRLGPTIIHKEYIDEGSSNLLERIKRKYKYKEERPKAEAADNHPSVRTPVKRMSMRIKAAAIIGSFFGILAVYSMLVGLYLSGQYASSYHDYCDYTREPPHATDFVNIQRTTEVQPLFHFFEESARKQQQPLQRLHSNFLEHEITYLLTLNNFTVNPSLNVTTLRACESMASVISLACLGGVRCRDITSVEKSASGVEHYCVVNVSTLISFAPRGSIRISFPKLNREDPSAESDFDSVNVTILTPSVVSNMQSTLFISGSVTLGQPCAPPAPYAIRPGYLGDASVSRMSRRNLRICEYTLQQHFIMTQYQDCNLMSTAYHDFSTDYFVTLSFVDISEELDNQTRFGLHYTLYSDQSFVFNKQTKILSFNTVLVYSFIGAASIYGFVGLVAATLTTTLHYGVALVSFLFFVLLALVKETVLLGCVLCCRQSRSEARNRLVSARKRIPQAWKPSLFSLDEGAGSSLLVQSPDQEYESHHAAGYEDGASAGDEEDIVVW